MSKGIRFKKNNENAFVDRYYRVGDLYLTESSDNPTILFGGVWELQKILTGGELIGYACVVADNSFAKLQTAANYELEFSHVNLGIKTYTVENYISNVLEGTGGTVLVHPQNIVGMVEANLYITGKGTTNSTITGLWWKSNKNPLPDGVTLLPSSTWGYLSTGPIGENYGGSNNTYLYKVDNGVIEDFFVNPSFRTYNGGVSFSVADTKSHLLVKAYAKKGSTKVWKRTA